MKPKQTISHSLLSSLLKSPLFALVALFGMVGWLAMTAPVSYADTGACSKKASYDDPCMTANYNKAKAQGATMSASQFNALVHECEGRDSAGANIGKSFDSQSGSCANAIASCYSKVNDQRACQDDTVLAYGAGINDGEIDSDDWGDAIDFHNKHTGGDDYATNASLRSDRNKTYNDKNASACDGFAVTEIDACKKRTQAAFDACYDQLGGSGGTEKKVSQSDLDKCIQEKRIASAENETECKAAGGKWNSQIQGPRARACESDPTNPNNVDNKNGNGNNNKGGGGGVGNAGTWSGNTCGKDNKVKTNIIPCQGEGAEAIGNLLRTIITILTVLIGILAVGGIVFAAMLYASARDNASQTQQAIGMIRNIVIGILLYGFMVAILTWLVPGLSFT